MAEEANLYPLWMAFDLTQEAAREATMEDWEEAEKVFIDVLNAHLDIREYDGVNLGNSALRLALEDAAERAQIEIDRLREREKERTREAEPTEFGLFLFEHMKKQGIADLEALTYRAQTAGITKVCEAPLRKAVYNNDALYDALTSGRWGPCLPYLLLLGKEERHEMIEILMRVLEADYATARSESSSQGPTEEGGDS